MRDLETIITSSLGVILVALAAFLGIRYHRNHTPGIAGQIQGEVRLDKDGISAMDAYTISDDKTVELKRSFSFDDQLVVIEVNGEWIEKVKCYKLTFETSSAEYLSEEIPLTEKGRRIHPKKFLDKRVRIPKAGISTEDMLILLQREDARDEKGWVSFKLHRNESSTTPIPSFD